MPSDEERELVEVIQLAYRKLYLKDELLSRAIVEGIMEKAMRNTIGNEAYKTWLANTKCEIKGA